MSWSGFMLRKRRENWLLCGVISFLSKILHLQTWSRYKTPGANKNLLSMATVFSQNFLLSSFFLDWYLLPDPPLLFLFQSFPEGFIFLILLLHVFLLSSIECMFYVSSLNQKMEELNSYFESRMHFSPNHEDETLSKHQLQKEVM